ncbi:universal stress protein [Actinomadura sp. NBRC 104425]|uniref:universal stress protein n=1 Tax=Actinomadura sp. NBRC 104425 TaxID=3032204 RepID=UPI0024A49E94|nr:universal stress protein [Actinomadura sp. NBRC 104425]GLZ14351.1 universal stress protein [Actinomadura sp. NBRC 104425]
MTDPALTDPVLVGTDGSDSAHRAVLWAADEAVLRNRPLLIVHALDSALYAAPLFAAPQAVDALTDAGRRMLAEAVEIARERRPEVQVSTRLLTGRVSGALRELSREAFELVLGHRGLGGFSSLLLGSTGLTMAGHAAGPVVIVRGAPGAEHGEIVVGLALERDEDESETLRYAFEAAAARGARVLAMNAWEVPAAYAEANRALDDRQVEEKIRWRLIEAHAPWRKAYPDVEVTERVVREHPVTALCDASREADLLVVGPRRHRGLAALGLGSVSHGVIHHAHCPVAIARARADS